MAPRGRDFWRGSAAVRLELDTSEIQRVIRDLEASEADVGKAMSRALRRTASALRVRASKRIVPELQLRRAMDFRRRLKDMRVRMHKTGGEVGIWIGLNDMAVSQFKGRVSEYPGGAKFRQTEYPGAFVAKTGGRRSIFRRVGAKRFPIAEEKLPIKDQLDVIIEDEIFPEAVEIFMRLFAADLRARSIYGIKSKHG